MVNNPKHIPAVNKNANNSSGKITVVQVKYIPEISINENDPIISLLLSVKTI